MHNDQKILLRNDRGRSQRIHIKAVRMWILLISDMKMPGMNGLEFIKKAKKIKPEIICYILSGYDIIDEIKDALYRNLIKSIFLNQ